MTLKKCLLLLNLAFCATAFADVPIKFSLIPECEDKAVSAMIQESDASLWMNLDKTLYRFNGHTLQAVVHGVRPDVLVSTGRGRIYAVKDGFLVWIDTGSLKVSSSGIAVPDDSCPVCKEDSVYVDAGRTVPADLQGRFPVKMIRSVCRGDDGNIYIGSANGLYKALPSGECFRINLTEKGMDPVRCLFKNANGDIWIGTYYDGLFFMHPGRDACSLETDLLKKVHGAVEGDDGTVFYFTDGNGIFKSGPGRRPSLVDGTDGLKIQCAYKDADGSIWCGGFESCLLLFDGRTGRFESVPFDSGKHTVNCITSYRDGLAIGTNQGVYLFSPAGRRIVSERLPGLDGNIFSLASSADTLWIGSEGLHYYIGEGTVEMYSADSNDPLNFCECRAVCVDPVYGALYVGTSGNGFCRLSGRKADWIVNAASRPGGNSVAVLAPDGNGHIIAGTSEGVSIVDVDRKVFCNFTLENCPGAGSVKGGCVCRLSDGSFLVGGKESVMRVRPDCLGTISDTVEFFIDGIREAGTPLSENRFATVFPYDRNDILIEIGVPEYDSVPSKVFSCRLLPLEEKWREVNPQEGIEYRNLPPGKYTVKIRASRNGEAPFFEKERSFTIRPIWYAAPAAVILWILLAAGAIVYAIYMVYSRLMLRESLKAEKKRSEERNRTFVDISRKLRTPLTLALGELDLFFLSHRDKFPGRGNIEASYHNAMKMKELIAEYVDLENDIESSATPPKRTLAVPLAPLPTGAKKMLVVDDNPEIRRLLFEMFSGRFHIIEAADGKDAVQLARGQHPDIILSDVQMPGMDGISLCCALKSDSETCQIPLVLLTAHASENDRLAGIKAGADDYMTKPFSREVLTERCDSLIRMRSMLRDKYSLVTEVCVSPGNDDVRERLLGCIERHLREPGLNVEVMCKDFGTSRTILNLRTRENFGMSPRELIEDIRLRHAANMILESRKSVAEISEEFCFCSPKYFAARFKNKYGYSPTNYRNSKK